MVSREPADQPPEASGGPNGPTDGADRDVGRDVEPDANVDDAEARIVADLDALRRERDELLDTSRRLQADFENYRKRVQRDQASEADRAVEGIVTALLPVLDTFEMALTQIGDDADIERVRKGVDLVSTELGSVLERAGLERVDGEGAPFDPHVHEAVAHDAGEGEPVVAEVLRTGYRFRGRVVRPAMVRVAADASDAPRGGAGEGAGGEEGP